jgi:hypothetical protein
MLAVEVKSTSTFTRVVGSRRILQISVIALLIVTIAEILGINSLRKRLDDVDVKIDAVLERLDLGVLPPRSAALVQAPAVLVAPPRVAPVQPQGQLAVLITPSIVAPLRPQEQLTLPQPFGPVRSIKNR